MNLSVLVSLDYDFAKCGNSSVICNFRNDSESIICLANLLEIFPLQLLFHLNLNFSNVRKEESPEIRASNSAAEAVSLSLAFWKRGLVLMRTHGSLLIPDVSLTTVMRLAG